MFKKIDKILAALGSIKAMERLHVDTFTEDKIINVEGDKIAESEEGQLYVGLQELNGYLFLETILVSGTNFKTFDGATLSFLGEEQDFILKSDTQEIISDHSNVSGRFMTHISFDITEEEIELIRASKFKAVLFECKKKKLSLQKV
ncbi:hypothetical protein ATE92_1933 [Ulvibacter sp. MAR_2010_11]|uniref:hypothetical protein n=1 Tax=Ulvibacter sp. MAR_2010_11 TaxID=1250229 RepID=UPI000C2BCF06|nr:hypothetical protein [Ulvibacter sp. MAR_2010_11]PKA83767.1 hypothetical protein ATE92_1933 [Ulvibacter sp. MAR_2010_11]